MGEKVWQGFQEQLSVEQDGQGSLHGKVKCEYRLGGGKGARQMNTWRGIFQEGQQLQ